MLLDLRLHVGFLITTCLLFLVLLVLAEIDKAVCIAAFLKQRVIHERLHRFLLCTEVIFAVVLHLLDDVIDCLSHLVLRAVKSMRCVHPWQPCLVMLITIKLVL